jgi:NAD(P)H-nitrite reductase large subunit
MAQRLDAQGVAPTPPLSNRDTGKEAQPLGRQSAAARPPRATSDFGLKPGVAKESAKIIAPHFPGGVLTPDDLRKIADACEKFPEARLRLSGDLVIGGFTDPSRHADCQKLLGLPTYSVSGFSIRPVKICSGGYLCDNNLQDSFALGIKLDQLFAGKSVPAKLVMGVAGCGRNCSEPLVKDIGVVATPGGYTLYAGGAAGAKPRLAQKLADQLDGEQVIALVEKILSVYVAHGKPRERLGSVMEKLGLENFKAACGLPPVPPSISRNSEREFAH